MAKRQKVKRFSVQTFDAAHYRQTEQYTQAVDALFDKATAEIARAAAKGKYDPDKPFSFDDYPSVKAVMQSVTKQLASRITTVIETGSKKQWLFACSKNDGFISSILDTSKLSKAQLKKMQDQNLDALKTFQGRKVEGMNLSQRIWKYVGQYREQLEAALDAGLGEGRSAAQLSRDVRQNLKDPNRLFRRVRDKRGNLVLSKAARAFHPGRGVYRSSAKNAARLTRSEINMAYRESDYLRWQSLDFVVGFEVKRSNHEPLCKCDICEKLKGRYPKHFKFKGWHPQCMCYAVPILMDEETFDENELGDLKAALRGTQYKRLEAKNVVVDVPDGFKEWVKEHEEAQANWSSTPYFIKDNFTDGKLSKGLNFETKKQIDPVQQQLNALMPQITQARMLASKWGLTVQLQMLDKYVAEKDIVRIPNRIATIQQKAAEMQAVIYHEYGHCIDAQRDLWKDAKLTAMRNKQIKMLKKKKEYVITERKWNHEHGGWYYERVKKEMSMVEYVDKRLEQLIEKVFNMKDETFTKRGITKMDVIEQIGSTRDTIKSLVVKYGYGHSTAYFRKERMKETEYLAHAFENAFIGNRVFQKYLPDIYNEMIAYVKTLKPIK